MKTLLRNGLVLTMADGPRLFRRDILVNDGTIARIAPVISPDEADRLFDCADTVLMPGFKDAHTHSAMTFARSSSDNLSLQDWLTKCIFPMEDHLQKGDVYNLTKGSFLEYLTSGITACYDMYYAPDEIAAAAVDFGFRTVIMGTCTSDRQSVSEMEEAYKKINGLKNPLVSYRVGFHAEYTLSEEKLQGIKYLSQKYKAPVSTHSSESATEVEACKKRRDGLTPTEFFEANGLFDYGGTTFHDVFLSDHDIEILKKRGVYAVSCPGSNSKLASGIAPITALAKAGIDIALGTDGAGSNNCLDMFKEMALLFSLEKLRDQNPVTLNAYEILKMATVNGAHAMGLNNSDVLSVGKNADIIAIDLSRPNMRPYNDIISNIVYSGSKDNVKMTMIDGKILYLDHEILAKGYRDIYRLEQEISDRLNQTNPYKKTI